MLRGKLKHGFTSQAWKAAKKEARAIMIERARRGKTVCYSELVAHISSISLQAHDPRLDHFLGEIASKESLAGRGMLTVVVVHKNGDLMPGAGFFELADQLGHNVTDELAFWVAEMKLVQTTWRGSKKIP